MKIIRKIFIVIVALLALLGVIFIASIAGATLLHYEAPI